MREPYFSIFGAFKTSIRGPRWLSRGTWRDSRLEKPWFRTSTICVAWLDRFGDGFGSQRWTQNFKKTTSDQTNWIAPRERKMRSIERL